MVDCPNCGTKVAAAIKCWTVSPAKHTAKGYTPEFRVGIFECPKCKSKFRSRVKPKAEVAATKNIKDAAEKIQEIHKGLTQTLRFLREKINELETERWSLLVEIEQLKKVAESRAKALEDEVQQLRKEINSLRELLDASGEID